MDWDVKSYMQFGNERTQPAIDLAYKIRLRDVKRIIDLGCGSGNSTEVLKRRWPGALVSGLDSSSEMLAAARQHFPGQDWILADAGRWTADKPYDIVYSNAAIQWIPDHDELLPRLFNQVAFQGALAFQIPTTTDSPLNSAIWEVAGEPAWKERMELVKSTGALTIETPSYYYDILSPLTDSIDMWETEYYHIMENSEAIVDWIYSTGLRPFLGALDTDAEEDQFISLLKDKVVAVFSSCRNGRVLFPFRRLFVVAYR
jgi:trans-aconitate 2-methyltransferase